MSTTYIILLLKYTLLCQSKCIYSNKILFSIMNDEKDNLITLKIHQKQFDALYRMLLDTIFEGDTKRMVDLLYRTIRVPFRKKGDQLALILLDKRRQRITAAFLIKLKVGGDIQSIETIPFNLSYGEHIFSEIFQVKSSEFSHTTELAKTILEQIYGKLWTLIIVDFIQISKLYFKLDFEPTKELVGKIVKTIIDRIKEGKISLSPIPEVVNAIERIV